MFDYSVSKFFNYIQKDYIIDWLNIYGKQLGFEKEKKNTFFMDNGNNIKKNIKELLSKDFASNEQADLSQFLFNNHTHKSQTIKNLSNSNIKFIYQAFVSDDKFYGITDFIVKQTVIVDWMNKYSNIKLETKENLYSVVDVKSSCKIIDGKVSRSTRNYDWLQFQVSMYSKLLAKYNDVNVDTKAYIMSFKNNQVIIGEMDLIEINTSKLIDYMNDIKLNGDKWSLFPKPSVDYLYPNMKNGYDEEWRKVKLDISKKIGEWTLIPYVSLSKRNELWKADVKTFKDKDILTKLNSIPVKIDYKSIIEVNQEDVFSETRNGDKVKEELSKKIKKEDVVLYIDIETIYIDSCFYSFMICIYSSTTKEYITLMSETIEEIKSNKIVNDTSNIIEEYTNKFGKIKIVHYSGNESSVFKKNENVEYIDLYAILKDSHFAITGLYSLKLKELYKCIARNKEEVFIVNGLDAMLTGNKYYFSEKEEEKKKYKNDLLKYINRDVYILLKVIAYFNRY